MNGSTLDNKVSKTVEQRIEGLKNRNLTIDNYDLIYTYINQKNTYYHLTGYRFLLQNYNKADDDYNHHNSSGLIALSELDKELSLLLLKYTRKIEEALRTRLANLCGEKDMVTFFLDEENNTVMLKENYCLIGDLNEKFISEDLFNTKIAKDLYNDLNKIKEETAIKHYINEYKKVIPIWVVINFVSFGTLLKLIDCLTSVKLDQFMEGKSYRKSKNVMDPCRVDLKAIHMLRNKISHYSNILGKQSPYNIKGVFNSIYYTGYISICHWTYFLFKENITLDLRGEINQSIESINSIYGTEFDFSIIMDKIIK